ncbi:hypothetical protein SFUMM280S_00491 [Streptomyces fumanus]
MHEGQCARQGEKLEHTGKYGTHGRSQNLSGEDQGEDEIAQQGDGHDEADDVLGGHSFVTPLATRVTSAKAATVVTTKARSAIVSSWSEVRGTGTFRGNAPPDRFRPPLTGPLRPAVRP